MKSVAEIRERIERGTARVWTAEEFKEAIRAGRKLTPADVDVVTCGTCGVMSGTAAILSVRVAPPGTFGRADSITLNGVPAWPGPCPNENLGLVDLMVYGTARAGRDYGGGHLLRDIVEKREIRAAVSTEGRCFEKILRPEDIEFARLITSRSAFKNYTAFVNTGETGVDTIFSVTGLRGHCSEASVSGCGEINPLENDPLLSCIRPGTRVLLNGGIGYVMGEGTRSSPEKPNLSLFGDMQGMTGRYMGGFVTSAGPECLTSVGVPIPVTDQKSIERLSVLDEEISLPVVDIGDRSPLGEARYSDLWQNTDLTVSFDQAACTDCKECTAAGFCPTGAITRGSGIDRNLCMNCGTCVIRCRGSAFRGNLGSLPVGREAIKITLRQSDRARASEMCRDLRDMILDGNFII